MNDIMLLNAELAHLRGVLRIKQSMLRQANQDIYKLSRASGYLELVPGKKRLMGLRSGEAADEVSAPGFELIDGGKADNG
ncbi:MAG: hypothetical protein KDJ38_06540 [Gammaproteobacteria bacterium]|nr:hypothetical protein [Gammaproteobacteria bacterium]